MDHPECDVITYEEYQKIKSELLADAKALCKAKSYWAVCVAIKTVRNMYVVNKNTGYLFVANSDTEYYHKLEDWNFDGALVITVYLHEIDAATFTKYPSSYIKASSDITYPWVTVEFHGEIKAYGNLKDASLVHNIMEAMRRDDAFAKAMSDFYNPEYTTDIGDEDHNLDHFLESVSNYEVSPWSLRGQGLEAAGFDEVDHDLWVTSNDDCTATYDDSEFYGTGKVEYANGEVVDGLSFDEWIEELDSTGLL